MTGGPTRAYLDSVRYLTNRSTGKTAYEICSRLKKAGHRVCAIVGECDQSFEALRLYRLIRVTTNQQMHDEVVKQCKIFRPEVGIFAAAVLDFVPRNSKKGKLSSSNKIWKIELQPFPKIIDKAGKLSPQMKRIGFKLEWNRLSKKQRIHLGRRLIRERQWEGLVLNFLPEIGNHCHPALLFNKDQTYLPAETSADIAKWIVSQVS